MVADISRDDPGVGDHEEAAETVEGREAISGEEHVSHQCAEHCQIANVDSTIAKAFGGEHDTPPERHEISIQDQPSVRGAGVLRRVDKPFEAGEQRDRSNANEIEVEIAEEDKRYDDGNVR